MVLAVDLVIFTTKNMEGTLVTIFKTKDHIVPQLTEFQTVSGKAIRSNYKCMGKFTDSYANIRLLSIRTVQTNRIKY